MNNEIIFRILLAALFIGFVAHRGYYTRKHGRPEEDTLKQREEKGLSRWIGLLSIPGLLAVAAYIANPTWMAWAALPFPAWLRWFGLVLAVLGFGLLQWAHGTLGRNWSDRPRLMKEQALVMDGPYRWIRHPIYTAFLLIMGATLFISANLVIGLCWLGMTAYEVFSRVRFEEALMAETFGDEYRNYKRSTGQLLPRI